MVDLHDERDLVRVLARAPTPSTPKRRGDGVAAALDRELDDVLGVEVVGVRRERRAGRVLDALVDRQDRDVAGARPAGRGRASTGEVAQHLRRAVGPATRPVDEVGARAGAGPPSAMPFDAWVSRLSASSPSKTWMSTIAPPCKIGPATVVARRLRRSAEPGAGVLDDRRDLLGREAVGERRASTRGRSRRRLPGRRHRGTPPRRRRRARVRTRRCRRRRDTRAPRREDRLAGVGGRARNRRRVPAARSRTTRSRTPRSRSR